MPCSGQPFDLFLLLALGLLGFAMRRFGLPVLPLIVGAILGPLFERHLRRSLQTTGGDVSGLLGGPVSWVCYGIVIVVLLWPLVARLRRVVDRGVDGTGNTAGPAARPGGPDDVGGTGDDAGRPPGIPDDVDDRTDADVVDDQDAHDDHHPASTSGGTTSTRKDPDR